MKPSAFVTYWVLALAAVSASAANKDIRHTAQLPLPLFAMPLDAARPPLTPIERASGLASASIQQMGLFDAPVPVLQGTLAEITSPDAPDSPVVSKSGPTFIYQFIGVPKRFHAQLARAIDASNPVSFFDLCIRSGYAPTDPFQVALLKAGRMRAEAESLAEEVRRAALYPDHEVAVPQTPPVPAHHAPKLDLQLFGELVAANRHLSMSPWKDTAKKIEILQLAGYETIIGEGGAHILLKDASPAQIGFVFNSVLNRHRKR